MGRRLDKLLWENRNSRRETGGDGGFAEISGDYLDFRGKVDGFALGKAGSVLLDPTDITITGTSAPTGGSFTAGVWTSTAATATIPATTDANSVSTLLGTTNVTINTSTQTGGPFASAGTILISSAITWSTTNTLTLVADQNIDIEANISSTNSGGTPFTAMDFTASGSTSANYNGILVNAAVSSSTGTITMKGTAGTSAANYGVYVPSGQSISSVNGNILLSGTSTVNNNGVGVAISGSTVQTTGSGSIILSGTNTTTTGAGQNYGVQVIQGGGGFTATVQATGTGNVTFQNCQAGGGASSNGVDINGNSVITATNGTISFSTCHGASSGAQGNGVQISVSVVSANITLTAGHAIVFTDCVGPAASSGSGGISMNGGSTTLSLNASSIIATNTISSGAGGTGFNAGIIIQNVTLNATDTISFTATGNSTTTAYGFYLNTPTSATPVIATNAVNFTGIATGTGTGVGVLLGESGFGNSSPTTTTTFTVSGDSTGSSGSNSWGVQIGNSSFGYGVIGNMIVSNAQGGTGGSSHGLTIQASTLNPTFPTPAIAINGSFTATNNITGGTGNNSMGFNMATGAGLQVTNTGSVTIVATAPTGVSGTDYGAFMDAGTTSMAHLFETYITTNSGSISLTATSGNNSSSRGIMLNADCRIQSTSGSITLVGNCRAVAGGGRGISLADGLTIQTGSSGNIVITGNANAGSSSGGTNQGVLVSGTGGGRIATITATGSGNITFQNCLGGNGDGSFNNGLYIGGNSVITASGGNITFATITAGNGTMDVDTASVCEGIRIAGDSVNATSTITASGTVLFNNIQGGSNADNSVGVDFGLGQLTLTAATITMTNCIGQAWRLLAPLMAFDF